MQTSFFAFDAATTQPQNIVETDGINAQLPPNVTPVRHSSISDTFDSLNDDILAHILSYVMVVTRATSPHALPANNAPPPLIAGGFTTANHLVSPISTSGGSGFIPPSFSTAGLRRNQEQEEARIHQAAQDLLQQVCSLSQVSKRFQHVIGQLINAKVLQKLITPLQLYELKTRALSLNLDCICQAFLDKIRKDWNKIRLDERNDSITALFVIGMYFGNGSEETLVNLVRNEYLKYLVVKSVEMYMCNKACKKETKLSMKWKHACTPPLIIEQFWQAHMTYSPKKYVDDCNFLLDLLLGERNSIDNILEPLEEEDDGMPPLLGWGNERQVEGSNYLSKKAALFEFENQLARTNIYVGRFGHVGKDAEDLDELFGDWRSVEEFAKRLWEP